MQPSRRAAECHFSLGAVIAFEAVLVYIEIHVQHGNPKKQNDSNRLATKVQVKQEQYHQLMLNDNCIPRATESSHSAYQRSPSLPILVSYPQPRQVPQSA